LRKYTPAALVRIERDCFPLESLNVRRMYGIPFVARETSSLTGSGVCSDENY
jgi:hypothetical protein